MQFFDDDNEKGDYMIKKLLQPFRFHGRHKINFCLIARPWLQLLPLNKSLNTMTIYQVDITKIYLEIKLMSLK